MAVAAQRCRVGGTCSPAATVRPGVGLVPVRDEASQGSRMSANILDPCRPAASGVHTTPPAARVARVRSEAWHLTAVGEVRPSVRLALTLPCSLPLGLLGGGPTPLASRRIPWREPGVPPFPPRGPRSEAKSFGRLAIVSGTLGRPSEHVNTSHTTNQSPRGDHSRAIEWAQVWVAGQGVRNLSSMMTYVSHPPGPHAGDEERRVAATSTAPVPGAPGRRASSRDSRCPRARRPCRPGDRLRALTRGPTHLSVKTPAIPSGAAAGGYRDFSRASCGFSRSQCP